MNYDEIIARKIKRVHPHGFEPKEINPKLFDWQKLIVSWACRQGRAALFEDCGLGKTPQQLEWARQVVGKTKAPVLILAPLAVAPQTCDEGRKFGIDVKHVREASEVSGAGVFITNYERLEKFADVIPDLAGVVLDESSILKAFTGKTRIALTNAFRETPYRLCCTATPAPNDFTELGQHAEFLGVCSTQEMLATWFINDTANTGTWRLKKHGSDEFWRWVSTWAACISKPSDLGFDDGDFKLPPLNIIPIYVDVDEVGGREDELFRMAGTSATDTHREMRLTVKERVDAIAGLPNESAEPWLIWCNTNTEADELAGKIKDACEVRGSDTAAKKEAALIGFAHGEFRNLITKASIAGYGMNYQHCRKVIYFPSYSYEDFYQAIRRSWRFGQKNPVDCYVVVPRTTPGIIATIKRKAEQHETMKEAMQFTAENLKGETRLTIMNTDIKTQTGNNWAIHRGDCVRVAKTFTDESIDFSVFSPPFADLFVYSADVQDMGNNASMADFREQFDALVKELYRITVPGRLCAVHCLDLMAAKWKDGEIELKNFSGEIVDSFRSNDWLYHCRVTIWKDPVVEMQRTKALGLLHKQLLKDSAMSRVGSAEYVLVFRKPGVNPKPISHERADYPVEIGRASCRERVSSPV